MGIPVPSVALQIKHLTKRADDTRTWRDRTPITVTSSFHTLHLGLDVAHQHTNCALTERHMVPQAMHKGHFQYLQISNSSSEIHLPSM